MIDIRELKNCFNEDFTKWLLKSNHPKVNNLKCESEYNVVELESLQMILDILINNPKADYFWYYYPEHGGELSYSLPHHDVVPGDSLRIDKEKIKVFLRDIKISQILNYEKY